MENKDILLTIRTRDGVIYEGPIKGVTSNNDLGKFDVLTNHANFITIIKDSLKIYESAGEKEFKLDNGIMKVQENIINVLLGVKSG